MKTLGQPLGVRRKKGKVWGQCEHMPWGLSPIQRDWHQTPPRGAGDPLRAWTIQDTLDSEWAILTATQGNNMGQRFPVASWRMSVGQGSWCGSGKRSVWSARIMVGKDPWPCRRLLAFTTMLGGRKSDWRTDTQPQAGHRNNLLSHGKYLHPPGVAGHYPIKGQT